MLQSAIRLAYPPQCLSCDALTESDFALCGDCWVDTPFVGGPSCELCGLPLPGEEDGLAALCDDCLAVDRPWKAGRAALLYRDNARRLVLALKHGDRTELARPAGNWMAGAAAPLLVAETLIVPVPLHWTRLFRRRYNQSALLAQALGRATGLPACPDALWRRRRTPSLGGRSREERAELLEEAIVPHPRRSARVRDRPVLLVDDVMTSGATLTAATEALLRAGAREVRVVTLARAGKEA